MIFTVRMGVPEALPPAFHPCTKNKQHLSVFPSLQGLWWGLDIPELLLHHLARYCCSEAMVGWSPRCYPAPLQSWHALDRVVLRRAGEILSAETQPRDVPDWLIWAHLFLATDLNQFSELLCVHLRRTCCELGARHQFTDLDAFNLFLMQQ